MTLDRRGLLAGFGLAGLAGIATAAETPAPAPPPKPKPTLAERLAAEAPKHRTAMYFDGRDWSGPGLDRLIEDGSAAQFFLLGEEHGVAQIPALVRKLLPALKAAGYSRLGLEISPPGARALDRAVAGGVGGVNRFFDAAPPGPAFYTMKDEIEMLMAVRDAFPARQPLSFGLDYEVLIDAYLIELLRARAPAPAREAVAAVVAASNAAWARYEATGNIGLIFSFSGDPALVAAVRAAWPNPDPASDEILETLLQTLIINQHETSGRYFLANDTRARFNRANWARLWRAETAGGRQPKAFFKFGAGHMVRGRSMTEVYDIGSLVSETASLMGAHSFHLLAVPLDGGRQAALNARTLRYDPVETGTVGEMGLEPLAALTLPDSSTLFDLRPLRPLMPASVTKTADTRLARIVHGYDALLLIRDATASGNF